MANVEAQESGDLKDKPALRHFIELPDRKFKGVIVFGNAKEKKSFVLDDGKPLILNQNLQEGTLGKNFFDSGVMSYEQFSKIKNIHESGKTFFQAVMESQVFSQDFVFDFLLKNWIGDLAEVLSWASGKYAYFEFLPKDVTKIETSKPLAHYLFRALREKHLKNKTKFSPTVKYVVRDAKEHICSIAGLHLSEFENNVVEALKTPTTVKDLVRNVQVTEDQVAATVLAFQDLQIAGDENIKQKPFIPQSTSAPPQQKTAPLSEAAFFAKIKQFDKMNYFEIMDVPKTATTQEIQAAYYDLAKKYHPDRLKSRSDVPVKEVEQAFRKITEAYNTLINPAMRKEYEYKISGESEAQAQIMNKIMESEKVYLEGKALLNRNQFQEAVQKLKGAVALYDKEPEYYMKLGWALFRDGVKRNLPDSIAEGKKILSDAKNHHFLFAEVSYYLGMIAKHENKLDQALTHFRSSVQADPSMALAHSELRHLERKADQKPAKKK